MIPALRPWSALATALPTLLCCAILAHANTVTVPGDFPTVQAVVDSIDAHSSVADTVLISSHAEPSPLEIHDCTLTLIGVPDASGSLPTLPRTMAIEGDFHFRDLHFAGTIAHWGDTEFRDCQIDSGVVSGGAGYAPGTLRFVNCVLRGHPALRLIHFAAVDSCEVFGEIALDYMNDGGLTMNHSTVTGPGGDAIAFHGSNDCRIENCVIRGFDNGLVATIDDAHLVVRDNLVENCPGIALYARWASSGTADFSGNRVRGCGVGIQADSDGPVSVSNNVVLGCSSDGIRYSGTNGPVAGNIVGRSGGRGIVLSAYGDGDDEVLAVQNNTVYANGGSGIEAFLGAPTHIERNIAYGNQAYGLRVGAGAQLAESSCNDWFANLSGSVDGVAQAPGDDSLDPLFCDVEHDSVSLATNSPMLDRPGCGLIGARGVGCDARASSSVPSHVAARFELTRLSPNPGVGPVTIGFALPRAAAVELNVIDLQGRRVATLVHGILAPGEHALAWSWPPIAPGGTYFLEFRFPGGHQTRRMVRLR